MKPIFKILLLLSLAHVALTWTEEKPVEEDFCDAEWDGKVEYKAEGEKDEAQQPEEEEPPTEGAGEEERKPDDEGAERSEGKEEGKEEGGEPEEGPAGGEESKQSGGKTPKGSTKDDERGDPGNTYAKSAELVGSAANVDDVQDEYLKGSLDNRLQEHIRNPIIEAAGKLPNFQKIASCFKTMKQDLKKEIDASKKDFADCKKKTDSSYECMVKMEPGFAGHVKAIGEKIVQCMNKSQ